MSLTIVSAPAVEPITSANIKTKLGIASSDTSVDSQIGWMIPAARRQVESRIGRSLITQTWKMHLDTFPNVIRLPKGKAQTLTHVKYTASDGTLTTISASEYQSDLLSDVPRIAPAYGYEWPQPKTDTFNAVEVQWVAGYGDAASSVPEDIIEALYRIVGHWINNQVAIEQGVTITRIPFAVEQMLAPYVIPSFGPI